VTTVVVGVDLGTTSCKAGAFSLDGELLGYGSAPCTVSRPVEGWAEQDPVQYWESAASAIRQAIVRVDPSTVAALSCCGHTPTLVLVDRDARPVRPAIIWQDRRAASEAAMLDAAIPAVQWRELLGMDLPRNASYPPARLLWLRTHEPEALDRTYRLLQPKDYINVHLTGAMVSDYWGSKGLAHVLTGEPIAAYRALLGVDPALAPPCQHPHHVLGPLIPEAARHLGLPVGVPVTTGWTDAMAGMLGTGALAHGGLAFDIAGTSEVVGLTTTDEPRDNGGLLVAPVLDTDIRVVYGPTQTSGGAVQWFLDAFYSGADSAGGRRPLEGMMASTAEGLLFLPYLNGERAPIWNPQARGVFFRFSSAHTRSHFLRAVLEGVAFSIRHVLEVAERVTGVSVGDIRLSGGGLDSPLLHQIKADVLGKRVQPTVVRDAGTLGAAMLAALAVGAFSDIDAASASMVRVDPPAVPDPSRAGTYHQPYEDYRRLYERVRDLY